MIKKISIKKVATYGESPEELDGLEKINFVYGSNATGKTTISRAIANDPDYSKDYSDCAITWQDETELKTLVYNRDFIDKNFNQPDELEGIFTLGEKDKETLAQITRAKEELDSIKDHIAKFRDTLEDDQGNGGKRKELQECEKEFTEKFWELKQKHDEPFKEALRGYRADKEKFKKKLIEESRLNSATFAPLDDLKQRAKTVFGETPQREELLRLPDLKALLTHETNPILQKPVIGKSDVDIAAIIKKLSNSDWVKQGRGFYEKSKPTCPFCQQDTEPLLEQSLNEYFDDTFKADSDVIEKLYENYKSDSEHLRQNLQTLLTNPIRHLDNEKLQAASDLLDPSMNLNIQRIEGKIQEPSKEVELESLNENFDAIKRLLDAANTDISNHNKVVENLTAEKSELTAQVWRYLLDHEIKDDLASYKKKKENIEKAIANLEKQIEEETVKERSKEEEIKNLEKDTTSIQPTIDDINDFLTEFGFQGFSLAKSDRDRFYKIERADHSDAKTTLSEGEKSFVAFLYFYHLLKGSISESGITSDRVVVFDDPVSSLDSDILFIVSTLIQKLFDEMRNSPGTIKQVFVLTHNVYFHKQVSFDSRRDENQKLKDETFWIVRKSNIISKIKGYKTNPIKTGYELLWDEVRNSDRNNLAIQNTLRRILENYFKILGGVDFNDLCEHFKGKEKQICNSLFSWVNDGSHSAHDSLYVSNDSDVQIYLNVFKRIFEEAGHIAHYKMMMSTDGLESQNGSP